AEQGGKANHRMEMARRRHHADECRKHDKRHDARFHQRDIVADAGHARLATADGPGRVACRSHELCSFAADRHLHPLSCWNGRSCLPAACSRHYLMSGSSLYWWNGGGEGSVHSRVVAAAPHGLSAAFSLRKNAHPRPKKNTKVPNADTNEPTDD